MGREGEGAEGPAAEVTGEFVLNDRIDDWDHLVAPRKAFRSVY